jgi:hypothetical protein
VGAISSHCFLLINRWRPSYDLTVALVDAAVDTPTSHSEMMLAAHCSCLDLGTSVPA